MALPSPTVKSMQQALHAYATAVGFAPAEPGAIDGIVGNQTMTAVIAMVPLLPVIPSEVKAIAQLGPIALASPDVAKQAKKYITSNAGKIRDGIIGLAAYQVATGKLPKPGITTLIPITVTAVQPGAAGGGLTNAIYFYDTWRNTYRVALPAGLQGLSAAYVEVGPTTAKPAAGTQVSRTTFLMQTGQWYKTTPAIAGFVATGIAALGGLTWAVRR